MIKSTAPTVIDVDSTDDDDVIVCDDSHISELHSLKNTSDSKGNHILGSYLLFVNTTIIRPTDA